MSSRVILSSNIFFVALLVIFGMVGCGGSTGKKAQNKLSGMIQFNGKPIPTGAIMLEPNIAKGNNGPGVRTEIKDGHYETLANKGIVGGQYIVSIAGYDGVPKTIDGEFSAAGTSMFPTYRTEQDFPKEDSEWNFEIPSSTKK